MRMSKVVVLHSCDQRGTCHLYVHANTRTWTEVNIKSVPSTDSMVVSSSEVCAIEKTR